MVILIKLISTVVGSFTKFVFSEQSELTKHVKDEFNDSMFSSGEGGGGDTPKYTRGRVWVWGRGAGRKCFCAHTLSHNI